MYRLSKGDFSYARIMSVAKKIDPEFNSSSYIIAFNLVKTEVNRMKDQVDEVIDKKSIKTDYQKINKLSTQQMIDLSSNLLLLMFVLHIEN